jgi:hypothetical protein
MRSAPLEAYDATLHAFCIVPMLLSHGFGIDCIEQDPQDARALLHPENVIARCRRQVLGAISELSGP